MGTLCHSGSLQTLRTPAAVSQAIVLSRAEIQASLARASAQALERRRRTDQVCCIAAALAYIKVKVATQASKSRRSARAQTATKRLRPLH